MNTTKYKIPDQTKRMFGFTHQTISELKFKPIFGTTNKGQEYEEKVAAFLTLKMYQKTQDFWISCNMEGMAPVDDIIICTKEPDGNSVYFFQIKHSHKSIPLQGKDLNEEKLSMHVLYNKFKSIRGRINNCIPKNYQPITACKINLFTNRSILKVDIGKVFISKDDQSFNTESGEVYGLNPLSFRNNNDLDFCDFLNSVHIYANQANISDMEQNVGNCIKDILDMSVSSQDCSSNYINFIHNWIQIPRAKIGLNYKFIKNLIEFSYLQSNALEIDIINTIHEVPGHYLWEDIKNLSLYVTKSHLPYLTQMISNNLHAFDKQEAPSEIVDVLFPNYDYEKLTLNQKYILCCFLGQLPLIVDIDQFSNLPNFQFKCVSIGDDNKYKNLHEITEISQLLDERITLSCNREVVLRDILGDSNEILLQTSISDALSLLNAENDNDTLLHWAVENNKMSLISDLLSDYQNFSNLFNAKNNDGRTPLSIDKSGRSVLHLASTAGNIDAIRHFLKYSNINEKDGLGKTPLHYTAEFGKLEAAKFLIDKAADCDCLDNDGNTALHLAAIGGHIKTIKYFLRFNNVNVKNTLGKTPLHYTAEFGKLEAAKFLIDKAAARVCFDNDENSGLHLAAIGGHLDTIEYFLQFDNINVKNTVGKTPLHYSAEFGKLQATKFLISKGARVKCLDNYGNTGLHLAAIGGHVNTIEYILQFDDINVKNILGKTPLHYTAEFGKLEAAKYLIHKAAHVNCLDLYENTGLHLAVIGGHLNAIQYFLQFDDINVKNSLGRTTLHYTAELGKLEAAKFLISKGADAKCLDNDGNTALHLAAIQGHINTIEYFLQLDNINVKNTLGKTPLHYTAECGKLDATKFLIYKGAEVKCLDNDGNTTLHIAAIGGHLNTIEYFLQLDNINVKNNLGKTPLHYTAELDRLEATKLLTSRGADSKCLDNYGNSALIIAVIKGHTSTIEHFLQYNDINMKDGLGKTPLHVASQRGNLVTVEWLMSNKADFKCMDNDGSSCLHYASMGGDINTIEYFIQYEDINVKNALGKTPLHYAAENGKLRAVAVLLHKDADIRCLDNNGDSILHLAAKNGLSDVIKYLIPRFYDYEYDIDNVHIKNKFDQTPLDLAIQNEQSKVVDILRSI